MNKTITPAAGPSEKSLVARVSALAGPEDRLCEASGATVPTKPVPVHPVRDGTVRLTPVQVLYRAEDYYRRLVKKCVWTAVLIAAAVTAVGFLLGR